MAEYDFSQVSNIVNAAEFTRRKGAKGQLARRVWVVPQDPMKGLRRRFITGEPSVLKALYAPRTSKQIGSKNPSDLHDTDLIS